MIVYGHNIPISELEGKSLVAIDYDNVSDRFDNKSSSIFLNLNLGEYGVVDIELQENNIVSRKFKSNTFSTEGSANPPRTFQGYVVGDSESKVRLTYNDHFLYGFVEQGDQVIYFEPYYHYDKGSHKDILVAYTPSANKNSNMTCGTDHTLHSVDSGATTSSSFIGDCYTVEIALAADYSMYQEYGTIEAVQNHNIGVINNVQSNYLSDFDDSIMFEVVEHYTIDCNGCDPWTNSIDPDEILRSFTSWARNGLTETHDMSTLWTRRNLANGSTVGIAWIGTVCTSYKYSVCQDFSNDAHLKRVLQAHELGHNFSADHVGESGKIMSLSVENTNDWSSISANAISAYIPSLNCLAPSCAESNIPPSADFDFEIIQECNPTILQFVNRSSFDESREWVFNGGDPSRSTEDSPIVTYHNEGKYDVTLAVANETGVDDISYSDLVDVTQSPEASFTYEAEGIQIQFNSTSKFADYVEWNFGDGSPVSNNNTIFHTYAAEGEYLVKMIAYNGCGQDEYSTQISVSGVDPSANFTINNTNPCPSGEVLFTNLSTNADNFYWEFPGGTPAVTTVKHPTVQYVNPGKYDVILVSKNNFGESTKQSRKAVVVKEFVFPNYSYEAIGREYKFFNSSHHANSYIWNFGDGNSSTDENPIHTYTDEGTYQVVLTAINECGEANKQENVVAENPIGKPTISIQTDVSLVCEQSSVRFQNQSPEPVESYSWKFPGGIPLNSTDAFPIIEYNNPGTYTVTLTVTNEAGSTTQVFDDFVTVNPFPKSDFGFISNDLNVVFENRSEEGVSYLWDFGDNTTSSAQDPTHDYSQEGTYEVVLTTSNECGMVQKKSTIAVAKSVSLPSIAVTVDSTSICASSSVVYSNVSAQPINTYAWEFPGGTPSTSTSPQPEVNYNEPGTYSVVLSISNEAGTVQEEITNIIEVRPHPIAAFSYTGEDLSYSFVSESTNGRIYEWDFGDNTSTSTVEHPRHVYASEGTYRVILTAKNDCGIDQMTQTITVSKLVSLPTVSVDISNSNVCASNTVDYSNTSTQPVDSYLWSFPGGTPAESTSPQPSVVYSEAGTYDVILQISNEAGTVEETISDVVEVAPNPNSDFTFTTDDLTYQFTNRSQDGTSYVWDFGDGNTSVEVNPTHTYRSEGSYTVSLQTSNTCSTDRFAVDVVATIAVQLPTINVNASNTRLCEGGSIRLENLSNHPVDSYMWEIEGGQPSTSSEASPVVRFGNAGSYSISLTVSNEAGTVTQDIPNFIHIDPLPIADFNFSSNELSVEFSDQSFEADSYRWELGDRQLLSTEASFTHTFIDYGVYNVYLTVSNECGSHTREQEIALVQSFQQPTASFTTSASNLCETESVSYINESSHADRYQWIFEGGQPSRSTLQSPTVNYPESGSFDVMLIASNEAYTDTIFFPDYMIVGTVPTTSFSFDINGNDVTFSNLAVGATIYQWDFGDGNTSTDVNPVHTYAEERVYTVTLLSNNECGSTVFSQNISVGEFPAAGLSVSATEVCSPNTILFENLSSDNTNRVEWYFEGGNPSSSTIDNPNITYSNPGSYDVTLIAMNDLGVDTITYINYIDIQGQAKINATDYDQNGNILTCSADVEYADNIAWDLGDGNIKYGGQIQHVFEEQGTYVVECSVSNACGEDQFSFVVQVYEVPIPSFVTATRIGCSPQEIKFENRSQNAVEEYTWEFEGGNPSTSSLENPTVVYAQPGSYSVKLTVANPLEANTNTWEDYITIEDLPSADFEFDIDLGTRRVTFNALENADSYLWDFGNGVTSIDRNPTHIYDRENVYQVSLTTNNACGSDLRQLDVNVTTDLFASYSTSNTSGCIPLSSSFFSEVSDNVERYEWIFEGGSPATSSEANPVITYSQDGSYPVTLIVHSGIKSDTLVLDNQVIAKPRPVSDFVVNLDESTILLGNTSTHATEYVWRFGDGTTSTSVNPSHTYSAPGTYQISLEAYNECGVNLSQTTVVIADNSEEEVVPIIATFEVSDVKGCAPLEVTYTNTSTANAHTLEWHFTGATVESSTDPNPVVTYTQPGFYSTTLIAYADSGTDTFYIEELIEVLEPPIPSFVIDQDGATIRLQNYSTNADFLIWDFGDGKRSLDSEPVYTYEESGTYTVTLTVRNTDCGDRITTQQVSVIVSSTDESVIDIDQIDIYPVPVEDILHLDIKSSEAKLLYLQLRDPLGKLVLEDEISIRLDNQVITYSIDYLAPGIYFIILGDGTNLFTRQIIKR